MSSAELRSYELVYVMKTSLDDAALNTFDGRVRDAVTAQGGSDLNSEVWGKRNLAYPIDRNFDGYYVVHRFQMEPTGTEALDRLLRFNEDVLRYLLVRKDE
jgi:small subunit ribosomal protein S6